MQLIAHGLGFSIGAVMKMNLSEEHIHLLLESFGAHVPLTYRFLKEYGVAWSIAKKIDHGALSEMGQCYRNAALMAAVVPGLIYCEGLACTGTLNFPMWHAWLVDEHGNAYDPTWADGGHYFGVPMTKEFLYQFIEETGAYGVLDGLYRLPNRSPDKVYEFLVGGVHDLKI